MANIQELPSRNARLYKLSDCIGLSMEDIKERISNIFFIDNYQLLIDNIDLVRKIVSYKEVEVLFSKDYRCLQYIENTISDYENITLALIDDFENKDRSYIDSTQFEKTTLQIPLYYLLWNPTISEEQNISAFVSKKFNMVPCNSNGFLHLAIRTISTILVGVEEYQIVSTFTFEGCFYGTNLSPIGWNLKETAGKQAKIIRFAITVPNTNIDITTKILIRIVGDV